MADAIEQLKALIKAGHAEIFLRVTGGALEHIVDTHELEKDIEDIYRHRITEQT